MNGQFFTNRLGGSTSATELSKYDEETHRIRTLAHKVIDRCEERFAVEVVRAIKETLNEMIPPDTDREALNKIYEVFHCRVVTASGVRYMRLVELAVFSWATGRPVPEKSLLPS